MEFCHSCGAPLGKERFDSFCNLCCDESGSIKSREEIIKGVSGFLMSWAPDKSGDFQNRAEKYVSSMPHWASK